MRRIRVHKEMKEDALMQQNTDTAAVKKTAAESGAQPKK